MLGWGGAVVGVDAGMFEVGISGVDTEDGSTVVGANEVVWTTVLGPLDDGPFEIDEKDMGEDGAKLLEKVTVLLDMVSA